MLAERQELRTYRSDEGSGGSGDSESELDELSSRPNFIASGR